MGAARRSPGRPSRGDFSAKAHMTIRKFVSKRSKVRRSSYSESREAFDFQSWPLIYSHPLARMTAGMMTTKSRALEKISGSLSWPKIIHYSADLAFSP
jgi:hypothetical protein